MKARIMPTAFLLAIASIYSTYYFSTEMFMVFPVFICTVCLIFKLIFKRNILLIILCSVWMMFFVGYTLEKTDYTSSALNSYKASRCTVHGKIIYEGNKSEFFEGYTLKIDKVADEHGEKLVETKEKADFSVRVNKKTVDLNYGDYICATVDVNLVGEAENSGEADFSLIKSAESIFYSLTADADNIKVLSRFEKISDMDDFSYVIREYVHDISEKMLSKEASAFVSAVLVSDKRYLSIDILRSLENAGLMHLSAASGLHVGCIITLITFIFGIFYVKRKNALIVAVPLIIAYIFINGGSVSIIRAAVMMFLVIAAEVLKRDFDTIIDLCFAGVVLLLENPLYVFKAGFVLSFASVAAIAVFANDILSLFEKLPKKKMRGKEFLKRLTADAGRYIKTTLSVCIAVQIVIMPLCAYYFDYVAVYSVISNLLISWVMPFFMLTAVFMLIFGFFEPVCQIFAYAAELISGGILNTARIIADLPYARIDSYITSDVMIFCLLVALAIHFFVKKKARNGIVLSIVCVLLAAVNISNAISKINAVQVSFVNVGQADGCMIKLPGGEAIVIDGGGSAKSKEDTVFVPYMKRNGIKKVGYIFVSHYDVDHAKNVLHVLDEFEVVNVVLPIRAYDVEYKTLIENKAKEKKCNVIYAKNGDKIDVTDNIKVSVYAPTKYAAGLKNENKACMAFEMSVADRELLFLGDLEADVQEAMSEVYREELKCDIIKIAHHGSEDAYCRELMEFAKPGIAVISCGKNNIYNHPDEEVVSNLAEREIRTFVTAERGDITFYIRENKMTEIRCHKR